MAEHSTAMASNPPRVEAFRGLNNVARSERLGPDWLRVADGVLITADGALEQRPGLQPFGVGAAYPFATEQGDKLLVVAEGQVQAVGESGELRPISALSSSARVYYSEINGEVTFCNGPDSGVVRLDLSVIPLRWQPPVAPRLSAAPGGNLPAGHYRAVSTLVLPDGRETGASSAAEVWLEEGSALRIEPEPIDPKRGRQLVYLSAANSDVFQLLGEATGAVIWDSSPDELGRDCLGLNLWPLPDAATVIQHWQGRLFAGQSLDDGNSAVWFSKPLAFHLFDTAADFFMVPGEIRMLASHAAALIVGTSKGLWAFSDGQLKQLAPYGVPAGLPWARDEDGRVWIWSQRGICTALPFANLTSSTVSVPPGTDVHAHWCQYAGQRHFLVSTAADPAQAAFNPRSIIGATP